MIKYNLTIKLFYLITWNLSIITIILKKVLYKLIGISDDFNNEIDQS